MTGSPLDFLSRQRAVLAVLAFALLFSVLSIRSYVQKSLAIDEGSHLTDGYLLLQQPGFEIRADRTQFLNIWMAWPLLAQNLRLPTVPVADRARFNHAFFFELNDCDRVLFWSRFMVVMIGVVLGIFVFGWANELFGFWPAVFALALLALEPNLLTNSGVATQDLGAAGLFFGTSYFLWRLTRQLTPGNWLGFAVCLALGLVSKFTLLLLIPVILVLLLLVVTGQTPWRTRVWREHIITRRTSKALVAGSVLVASGAVWWCTVWATYGFRYSADPASARTIHREAAVIREFPVTARLIGVLDDHRWLPNDYTQSLLDGLRNTRDTSRPVYLAGRVLPGGRWYYFPIVFLVKTPLALMLSSFLGLGVWLWQKKRALMDVAFVLVPMLLFLIALTQANMNVGVRHMLPVYPFVILLAGGAAHWAVRTGRAWIPFLILTVAAVELATVAPHYRAFFNLLAGGPSNGHRILVDSNADWGQDIKLLKQWMTGRGLDRINLGYWGETDPGYYGIDFVPLPTTIWHGDYPVTAPSLPGYVAVSVNLLHDPAFGQIRSYYADLLHRKPVALIGYSIRVYWIEQPSPM